MPHIVQSNAWGEVKSKIGTPAARVGDVQFTLHKLPLLPFNVGYCPKVDVGKIDWEKLKEAGKQHRCIFIKIEPNQQFDDRLTQQLRPSKPIFATQTILLDITKPEEELLKNMKSKTRYNVRLAQRKGVVVEEREDDDALKIFLRLQRETAKRQGFFVHPDSYYRTVWEVLHPKGMAYLLIANVQKEPVVAWMLLEHDQTLYYPYGGSSTKYRNYMPSNLMMWEAIKLGKKLGCKVFDMWGATDDKTDPWYGFTRFKLGFGGYLVSFPGAYDLILNPYLYYPFIAADRLRWIFLELRRKFSAIMIYITITGF
jgi:lipid II:glycine glycyltransferase (peptidoglycan interpeptide bridge formation enzyme)